MLMSMCPGDTTLLKALNLRHFHADLPKGPDLESKILRLVSLWIDNFNFI